MPISSNRTIGHGVFDKFGLTGELRAQFLTGVSFLTIRPNLKQNESYTVRLEANFE